MGGRRLLVIHIVFVDWTTHKQLTRWPSLNIYLLRFLSSPVGEFICGNISYRAMMFSASKASHPWSASHARDQHCLVLGLSYHMCHTVTKVGRSHHTMLSSHGKCWGPPCLVEHFMTLRLNAKSGSLTCQLHQTKKMGILALPLQLFRFMRGDTSKVVPVKKEHEACRYLHLQFIQSITCLCMKLVRSAGKLGNAQSNQQCRFLRHVTIPKFLQ